MPLIVLSCFSLVVVIFHFSVGSFSWEIDFVDNPASTLTTSPSTQIALDDNTKIVTINTQAGFINEFIFFAILCSSIAMGIYMGSSFAFFPLKLIKDFVYRPQKPEAETIVLARQCLMKESEELIEQGRDLYDRRRDIQMNKQEQQDKKKQALESIQEDLLKLKRKKLDFRKSYEYYERLNNILDENPLIDILKLVLGCIFVLISIIIVAENIVQFQKKFIVFSSIVDILLNTNFLLFVVFHFTVYLFVIFSVYFSKYQIDLLFSNDIVKHDTRINETYTATLLENNNTLILVSLGYLKLIYWSLPNHMGYTYGFLYFNDILSNLSYIDVFYKQKLSNILFLIAFSTCTFLFFFVKTGKNILDQKVTILKKELQNQKQKLDQEEAKKKLLP